MVFPAEMLVDYVRVYQRDGETNIGCNPSDYPTMDYINNHYDAYASEFPPARCLYVYTDARRARVDPNLTKWQWDKPKNSLVRRVSPASLVECS